LDYCEGEGDEVADPYYGRRDGFSHMFDILEKGIDNLLKKY
jgi:protein-tyrosine-phosphatase